jgi:hypothetical protein
MKLDFTALAPFGLDSSPDQPGQKPQPSKSGKRRLIATVITDKLEVLGLKRDAEILIDTELPPADGQLICLKNSGRHLVGVWRDGVALTVEGVFRASAFELVGVVTPLVAFKSIPRGRN